MIAAAAAAGIQIVELGRLQIHSNWTHKRVSHLISPGVCGGLAIAGVRLLPQMCSNPWQVTTPIIGSGLHKVRLNSLVTPAPQTMRSIPRNVRELFLSLSMPKWKGAAFAYRNGDRVEQFCDLLQVGRGSFP